MTTDTLVQRLRERARQSTKHRASGAPVLLEAADRIDALEAEVEELGYELIDESNRRPHD